MAHRVRPTPTSDSTGDSSSTRVFFLSVAAAGIGAQGFVVITALRHGAVLRTWLGNLGLDPPLVTRSFLATYQWWLALPVVTTLLVLAVARGHAPRQRSGVIVLLVAVLSAMVLQAWMTQAWLEPLVGMIKKVG